MHNTAVLNYATLFKVSFARATDGDLRDRFFSRFYERFMGSSSEVAALFRETDLKQQEEMLAGSLSEMMDFFVTHESNPYIVTLARIHGVRGSSDPARHVLTVARSVARHGGRIGPGTHPGGRSCLAYRHGSGDRIHEALLWALTASHPVASDMAYGNALLQA